MENVEKNTTSFKPLLQKGMGKFNKYVLVGLFFIFWMLFFAEKDIFSGIRQYKKLNSLQKSEHYQVENIAKTQKELDLLKTNAQTIEKYAREKYLMKKDNEDIFIISNGVDNK